MIINMMRQKMLSNFIINYKIGLIKINEQNIHLIFLQYCKCGNIEIVKWLYKLSKNENIYLDVKKVYNNVFKVCNDSGYIEIVNWLCELENC